jgi:hypothetical protein
MSIIYLYWNIVDDVWVGRQVVVLVKAVVSVIKISLQKKLNSEAL